MVMRFTVVQHSLFISFPSSAWECNPESSSFPYKAS
jgi:hypothetical protein